jgi:predicted transcriptional regulator
MDWPHDPDSEEGSEGGRKYGMAILAKKVEEKDFPLTVKEFEKEFGDHPVRINHERVVPASEILEHVGVEELEDKLSFNQAIGRAMRTGEFWNYVPGKQKPA